MSLTRKHVKIFKKIHDKHKVSLDFLTLNFYKIVKLIKYAASLHCVIKKKLKITKNYRVIIKYNFLRKTLFRDKNSKPKNKQLLPWSKRLILYKKKMRAIEKLNNSEENTEEYDDILDEHLTNDSVLPPEEVQKKLKEQLELLKYGKRRFSVFPDDNKRSSNGLRLSLDGAINGTAAPNMLKECSSSSLRLDFTNDDSLSNTGLDNSKIDGYIGTAEDQSTLMNVTDVTSKDDTRNEESLTSKDTDINQVLAIDDENLAEMGAISTDKVHDEEKNTSTDLCFKMDVPSVKNKSINVSTGEEQIKDDFMTNDKTHGCGDEIAASSSVSVGKDTSLNKSDISFEKSNTSLLDSSCERSSQNKTGLKFLDRLINKMQNLSQGLANTSQIKSSTSSKINNQDPIKRQTNKNEIQNDDATIEKESERSTITVNNCDSIKIVKATPPNALVTPNNTGSLLPTEESSSSSSSPDFLGFPEYELTTSTIPGMLPTPVVSKPTENNRQSAFVSEDLEKFLVENSLGTLEEIELPKRRSFEDGLVCEGAPAPKMAMPLVPHDLVKPRTVAEKRSVLQKKQSIRYYMIENENTIYRELKKRSKLGCANVSLVQTIQSLAVPFTRDCWRACSWLATTNGKFYFRMLNIDGMNVKLIGGHGNHNTKFLKVRMKNLRTKLKNECPKGCRQSDLFKNIKFKPLLDFDEKVEVKLKENNTLKDLKLPLCSTDDKPVKAGPLSTKCLLNSFEPDLGPLEIYKMPPIELEVYPKLNQPLDDFVKPYLKMILPSDSITKEWAEFAVSTLVAENQKTKKDTINSFTFTIPYLNEQSNVLVRKIYNRKEDIEKLDADAKLSFTNFIDKNNEFSVECGNILSEMINSVAIGLSGDSLIKDDPDIDYLSNRKLNDLITKRDSIDEPKQPSNVSTKKTSRLLKELNRLNAIVVDAESLYEPEEKKCAKGYCAFGCVCQSLTGQPIIRKHCKKTNCMLECTCKHVVTTDLDDFKSSTLTTEDALLIRKKATAKLAKVEKDFCSTVVLTDKETFLINERNTEKKRTKKAPKRFADYDYNTCDSPKKIDDEQPSFPPPPTLYPYDILPINPSLKKFKHCNVSLLKIPELNDLEPWCMIHGLYKCFCKGQATSGELYELKKDDTIEKQVDEAVVYSRKPTYSFDKAEPVTEYKFYDLEHDIKTSYYRAAFESCTRTVEVPSNTYKVINKRRVKTNKKKIRERENDKTKFMLLQRMNGALRYDVDTSEILSPTPIPTPAPKISPKQQLPIRNTPKVVVEKPKEKKVLHPLYYEEEIAIVNQPVVLDVDTCGEQEIQSQKSFSKESPKHPVIASVCSLTEMQPLKKPVLPSTIATSKRPSSVTSNNKGVIPLVENTSPDSSNKSSKAGFNNSFNTLPSTFLPGNNSIDKNKLSNLHSAAISKLNMAVTSSMHSICNIQKKNTKHLPTPLPNTLSSHQWKLFLQAYIEGLIYVWEIKLENGVFFGATPTSIMPIVPNALSVINIKAINKKKLPLFPKMLNARFINDKTKTLSVLMTGQRSYWRIIGFINSSYDYLSQGGIFKPTPKSHPWLSAKINNLYKLLVLKQIKIDQQQKQQQVLKQQEKQNRNKLNERKNNRLTSVGLTPAPQSNLLIRKVTHDEIKDLILPIPVIGDHQWLALDLCNDFTHIYIPQWKNFLSDERIRKAILLSKKSSKVVRIGHDPSPVDVYTSRQSLKRIFLGPYSVGHVADITLYQAVNSNMILREDFERTRFVSFQPKTTGFWLYKRNGKLMYDIDMTFVPLPTPTKIIHGYALNDEELSITPTRFNVCIDDVSLLPIPTSTSTKQKPIEVRIPDEIQLPVNTSISKQVNPPQIDDDYDDDCFIVEDEPKNVAENKKSIDNNSQEQKSSISDKKDVAEIITDDLDNGNKDPKSLSSTPPLVLAKSLPQSITENIKTPTIEKELVPIPNENVQDKETSKIITDDLDNSNKNPISLSSNPPLVFVTSLVHPSTEKQRTPSIEKELAAIPNENTQNKETSKFVIHEQITLNNPTSTNTNSLSNVTATVTDKNNKESVKSDRDTAIQNILSQLHVGASSPVYTSIVSGDRVYLLQSKETTTDSIPNLPKDLIILPEEQALSGKPDKNTQVLMPKDKPSSLRKSKRKPSTESETSKQPQIVSVRTVENNHEDQEPPLKKFIIQKPRQQSISDPLELPASMDQMSLMLGNNSIVDVEAQSDGSSCTILEPALIGKQGLLGKRKQAESSQKAKSKDLTKFTNNTPLRPAKTTSQPTKLADRFEFVTPEAARTYNSNTSRTAQQFLPQITNALRQSFPFHSSAATVTKPPAERTITNNQQHKYYQNLITKMREAVLSESSAPAAGDSSNSRTIMPDERRDSGGTKVNVVVIPISKNNKSSEVTPKFTAINPETERKRRASSSSAIKTTPGGIPATNLGKKLPPPKTFTSGSIPATPALSSASKMPKRETLASTTTTTSDAKRTPNRMLEMISTVKPMTVGNSGVQPFAKPTASPSSSKNVELGFVVSEIPLLGKYQVKKIGETYLLKMPHVKGTLRILGLNMVNKYLSQYVRQQFNEPALTKAKWHFVSSGCINSAWKSSKRPLPSNERSAPQPKRPRMEQMAAPTGERKQHGEVIPSITRVDNLNNKNGMLSSNVFANNYNYIPATISKIANTTITRSHANKKPVIKNSPPISKSIYPPSSGSAAKAIPSASVKYKIVEDKTKQILATEAKLKQLKDFNITPVKVSSATPKNTPTTSPTTMASSSLRSSSTSVTSSPAAPTTPTTPITPAAAGATVTTSSVGKPVIKKLVQPSPPVIIPTQNFTPHYNKNEEVILIEE